MKYLSLAIFLAAIALVSLGHTTDPPCDTCAEGSGCETVMWNGASCCAEQGGWFEVSCPGTGTGPNAVLVNAQLCGEWASTSVCTTGYYWDDGEELYWQEAPEAGSDCGTSSVYTFVNCG